MHFAPTKLKLGHIRLKPLTLNIDLKNNFVLLVFALHLTPRLTYVFETVHTL